MYMNSNSVLLLKDTCTLLLNILIPKTFVINILSRFAEFKFIYFTHTRSYVSLSLNYINYLRLTDFQSEDQILFFYSTSNTHFKIVIKC